MTFGNPEGYADGYTCRDTIMCAWWNADQQKCAIAVIAEKILEEEKG
jgi:hypothetical protein